MALVIAFSMLSFARLSCQVGRKPRVCVPGVPNHLTYADFGRFCASWASHILETRIIRYRRVSILSWVKASLMIILRSSSSSSRHGLIARFVRPQTLANFGVHEWF